MNKNKNVAERLIPSIRNPQSSILFKQRNIRPPNKPTPHRVHQSRPSGFILISCLFFITILMLWIHVGLETSSVEQQMSAHQITAIQNGEAMKAAISTNYQLFKTGQLNCIDNQDSAIELVNKPTSFWLSKKVCQGEINGQRFQSVFKSLEEDPCQTLNGKEGTEFWLMVIRLEQKLPKATPILSKTTFAVPKPMESCGHAPIRLTTAWASTVPVENIG